jgi:hypothetical protein
MTKQISSLRRRMLDDMAFRAASLDTLIKADEIRISLLAHRAETIAAPQRAQASQVLYGSTLPVLNTASGRKVYPHKLTNRRRARHGAKVPLTEVRTFYFSTQLAPHYGQCASYASKRTFG